MSRVDAGKMVGGKTVKKLKETFNINIFSSLREINDTACPDFSRYWVYKI